MYTGKPEPISTRIAGQPPQHHTLNLGVTNEYTMCGGSVLWTWTTVTVTAYVISIKIGLYYEPDMSDFVHSVYNSLTQSKPNDLNSVNIHD